MRPPIRPPRGPIGPSITRPGTVVPGPVTPGSVTPGPAVPGTVPPANPTVPGARPAAPGVNSPVVANPGLTIGPGLITNPGLVLDAGVIVRPDLLRPLFTSVDPLLLMPMRLEYRLVRRNVPVRVLDSAGAVREIKDARNGPQGRTVAERARFAANAEKVRRAATEKVAGFLDVRSRSEDHIWFRWYPDSNFSESGVAAPLADEIAARDAFLAVDANRAWPDLTDPVVNQAWQAFAGAVGVVRAVHLMRSMSEAHDPDWEARVGRIAALPERVALYAIKGGVLTLLGHGLPIPANGSAGGPQGGAGAVSYAPGQINALEWLTDFNAAVTDGMGLRLTDQAKVKAALDAEWIIAVGLHKGSAEAEIDALLRDRIANGEAEILAQDAPTNNSPSGTTGYRRQVTDIPAETARIAPAGAVPASGAAGLLAEALGLPPGTLDRLVNAADLAFADAQAMMHVIGPALLDGAMDGETAIDGVDETEFLDALAAATVARGALSPMRFGTNAYGIVPMTMTGELPADAATDTPRLAVNAYMTRRVNELRPFYSRQVALNPLRIAPDDPLASEKLDEILKRSRVSMRLDVLEAGSAEGKAIGCPQVVGKRPEHQPGAYLKRLRTDSIKALPDPDNTQHEWPLLYRLARISLTLNTSSYVLAAVGRTGKRKRIEIFDRLTVAERRRIKPALDEIQTFSTDRLGRSLRGALSKVDEPAEAVIRQANKRFAAALQQLEVIAARPQGGAQLETLLMETIDLFQHRIDAWATGLAYARLRAVRAENRDQGLFAGWYGMIGKLRPTGVTRQHDGYLQAPTVAQATSAAVMRSAYLRHRADGAFAINLRSQRANRGLKLLDMLRTGQTLAEALGLRGERWLRDNGGAGQIMPLRQAFPLLVKANDPTPQRLFDGLRFVKGAVPTGNAVLAGLHAALNRDLDALSDLVVAEAVHQRVSGAVDAAAAWLDVLSGGSVPGRPTVLRTQRYGHGSEHRVMLLLPEVDPAQPASTLRGVADPAFAALAEAMMPDFGTAHVEVSAALVAAPQTVVTQRYELAADLGMAAMDLVVGDLSEVKARAGHLARKSWIEGQAPFASLGSLPAAGTATALSAEVIWEIDTDHIETTLGLVEQADRLRRIGQAARPLDAQDLNGAADPAQALSDAAGAPIWAAAMTDMAGRARTLMLRLEARTRALTEARTQFFRDAFAAMGSAAVLTDEERVTLGAGLLRRWSALEAALWEVAGFGLPQALRLESAGDMLADLRGAEEAAIALETQLQDKATGLSRALASAAGVTGTVSAPYRGALGELKSALRAALDGEALPLAPVFAQDPAVVPLLDPPQPAAGALSDFAPVRKALGNVAAMLPATGWQAFKVSPQAVPPPDPEDDAETEPPVQHFGLFLSADAKPDRRGAFSGFVVDDWSEQRPSRTQDAAIAVNYDSPQGEAPNCMILCVPPATGRGEWTEARAAAMVQETIFWMMVRALPVHEHLTPHTLHPGTNEVPYKGKGAAQTPRIPEANLLWALLGSRFGFDAHFQIVEGSVPALARFGESMAQRTGFTRIKE